MMTLMVIMMTLMMMTLMTMMMMTMMMIAMLPIKKTPQSKCRLPVLNWCPMKPNQVKGTVFAEMDDEKLYSVCYVNQIYSYLRTGMTSL